MMMRYRRVIAVAVLAAAGIGGWYWLKESAPVQQQAPARKGGRFAQRDGPVPVTVETVKTESVPIYREGIGNVASLATVTVRSQVDGRLMSVEFGEGQNVRKGDVLARIDPTVYKAQYDQAVAKKAQDEATLANARTDLQRYQRLAQSNAGPQQQADQQAAVVAQLEAQVKSDDAAIDNAKAVLDYTIITSPLDGRAGLRLIDPGNIVRAGDSNGLVSVTQIKPIAVLFTLPQRDLPAVSAALQRGGAKVEVLEAAGRSVSARGTLQTIDVTTGTIKLKAIFPNDDEKLWPGQFVSTRVEVDTIANAKVVPTPAIRRGPSGTYVYVIGPDNQAKVRTVTVIAEDEARAVIGSEVEAGERVVTVGFAQLTDGKPVAVSGADPTAGPVGAAAPGSERKGRGGGGKDRRQRAENGSTAPSGTPKGTKEAAQ
jgi:multidrug efflux system membrane fusion protein